VDYRIWKYELELSSIQAIEMPVGAEILSVGNQEGILAIWAMVDATGDKEQRYIEIIGTGDQVPTGMGVDHKFIGTVLMSPFVWHVFERTGI